MRREQNVAQISAQQQKQTEAPQTQTPAKASPGSPQAVGGQTATRGRTGPNPYLAAQKSIVQNAVQAQMQEVCMYVCMCVEFPV